MTLRISSLACFSAAHVYRSIHSAAQNCAASKFRRTGRASVGVADRTSALLADLVLFILLFEHAY
ncbi:hypothetical protein K0H71_00080 [Bacillus sp. IITD106]|nr:hypothetical protein [Bacillus sp. IITD106]